MYLALNSNGFKESQPESLMNRNSYPVRSKNPPEPIFQINAALLTATAANPAWAAAAPDLHDPSVLP